MSYIVPNIKDYKLAEALEMGSLAQISGNLAYKKWTDQQFLIQQPVYNSKLHQLSATKYLAIYCYAPIPNSAGEVKARVITLSGDQITLGTEYSVYGDTGSNYTMSLNSALLSSTQAIVAFSADNLGTWTPRAVVLDISGDVITVNTPVEVEAISSQQMQHQIISLSSTKALMVYIDETNGLRRACAMSISGSVITTGIPVTTESAIVDFSRPFKLCKTIDDLQAVLMYMPVAGGRVYALVLDISVLVITVGVFTQITSGTFTTLHSYDAIAMTSTRILFFAKSELWGANISSSVITVDPMAIGGTPNQYSYQACLIKISSTKAFLVGSYTTQNQLVEIEVAAMGGRSRLLSSFYPSGIVSNSAAPSKNLNIVPADIAGSYLISYNLDYYGMYVLLTGEHGNTPFVNSQQAIALISGVAGDTIPFSIINTVKA